MRYILLFCSFMMLGIQAEAQDYNRVSGYLGHRFALSLGGGMGLGNNLQKQNSDINEEEGNYSLNKYWQADAQFAVKNYLNIGLRYGGCKTSTYIPTSPGLNDFGWGSRINGEYEHELRTVKGSPGITGTHIGLFARSYLSGKGALAPIGTYFGGGINRHTYDFDFSSMVFVTDSDLGFGNRGPKEWVLSEFNTSGTYYEYFMELGKVIPFGEHFAGDFSVKLALLYTENSSTGGDSQITEYLREPIRDRIQGFHILNYSFKLVYLI